MLIDEIWDRQRIKINEDLELFTLMRIDRSTYLKIKEEMRFLFTIKFVSKKTVERYLGLLIAIDNDIDGFELFRTK